MTINISSRDFKAYTDSIGSATLKHAAALDAKDAKAIDSTFDEMVVECDKMFGFMKLPHDYAHAFALATHERTLRESKGVVKSVSGTTFRKWAKEYIAGLCNVSFETVKKEHVRTTKDENGNVRPMTADEIRIADEKRMAKLEKELAAIRERMAK